MVNGDEANALTRFLALTLADDPDEAIEIPDENGSAKVGHGSGGMSLLRAA